MRVYFPNSILYPGRLNGVTQLKSRTADQPVRYGSLPEENNIKQTNHKNTRQNKTHNKHWRDQRKQQSLNIPRPGSGTRSQNTQNNTPKLTTLFLINLKKCYFIQRTNNKCWFFCKIQFSVGCRDYRYYGDNCNLLCPPNCQERRCDINTGHCLGCKPGYQGTNCSQSMCMIIVLRKVILNYIFLIPHFCCWKNT